MRVIGIDTLAVYPLSVQVDLAALWDTLLTQGLLTLPATVPRSTIQEDGHTYVLEVRANGRYRASVIDAMHPDATHADRVMHAVARTMRRYLAPYISQRPN